MYDLMMLDVRCPCTFQNENINLRKYFLSLIGLHRTSYFLLRTSPNPIHSPVHLQDALSLSGDLSLLYIRRYAAGSLNQ